MAKEKEMFVVVSKLKERAKALGVRTGEGFPEAVSDQVDLILEAASRRCKANNRSTLRPDDI